MRHRGLVRGLACWRVGHAAAAREGCVQQGVLSLVLVVTSALGRVRQLAALRRWRLCRLELMRFRRALHVWQHAHALRVTPTLTRTLTRTRTRTRTLTLPLQVTP